MIPKQDSANISPALSLSLCLLAVVLAGTGCFRPSSDVRSLGDTLVEATDADWDRELSIGVGRVTMGLARFGLSFVDDIDREAKVALSAVDGADVRIYRLRDTPTSIDQGAVLDSADRTMTARGWVRMVCVIQNEEMVAVYASKNAPATRKVRFCVFVLKARELVVASARGNPRPLIQLALEEADLKNTLSESLRF